MKAIIINLVRDKNRKDYVSKQLEKVKIEAHTIEAVDGRSLNFQEVAKMVAPGLLKKHLEFGSTWVTTNAIACAASHRKAYEYIVNYKTYRGPWLILEDDADLHPDLDAIWESSAKEMRRHHLDVILFYFSVVQDIHLETSSATRIAGNRWLYEWKGCPSIASSVGYLVSYSAATNLLEHQSSLAATADEWLNFYEQKAVQRVRLMYPFAVTTGLLESTLGSEKKMCRRRRIFRWVSRLGRQPLFRRAFLFLRKWDWSGYIKVV